MTSSMRLISNRRKEPRPDCSLRMALPVLASNRNRLRKAPPAPSQAVARSFRPSREGLPCVLRFLVEVRRLRRLWLRLRHRPPRRPLRLRPRRLRRQHPSSRRQQRPWQQAPFRLLPCNRRLLLRLSLVRWFRRRPDSVHRWFPVVRVHRLRFRLVRFRPRRSPDRFSRVRASRCRPMSPVVR